MFDNLEYLYQTIISEYQLSREIYYSRVNHQKTVGAVLGLGISVLISVVISCTYLALTGSGYSVGYSVSQGPAHIDV